MLKLNGFYMPKSGSNMGKAPTFSLFHHYLERDGTPGVRVGLAVNTGKFGMGAESYDQSRVNEVDIGAGTVLTFHHPAGVRGVPFMNRYTVYREIPFVTDAPMQPVLGHGGPAMTGSTYCHSMLESLSEYIPHTANRWRNYLSDDDHADLVTMLPIVLKAWEVCDVEFTADRFADGLIRGSFSSRSAQVLQDGETLHILAMDEWLAHAGRSLGELIRSGPLPEGGTDFIVGLATLNRSTREVTSVPGVYYSPGGTTGVTEPDNLSNARPFGMLRLDEIKGSNTLRKWRVLYQDILATALAFWTDVITELNYTAAQSWGVAHLQDGLPAAFDQSMDFWRAQAATLSVCREGSVNRDPEINAFDLDQTAAKARFHQDFLSNLSSSYRTAPLIPRPLGTLRALETEASNAEIGGDVTNRVRTVLSEAAGSIQAYMAIALLQSICLSQWTAYTQMATMEKVTGATGVTWNRLKRNLSQDQYSGGGSSPLYFPRASNVSQPHDTYIPHPCMATLNVAYFTLMPPFTVTSATVDRSRADSPILDGSVGGPAETTIAALSVIRDGGLSSVLTPSFSAADIIVNVPMRAASASGLDVMMSWMSDGSDPIGPFAIGRDTEDLHGMWIHVDRYGIIRNAEGTAQTVPSVRPDGSVTNAFARVVPGVTVPGQADAIIANSAQTVAHPPALPPLEGTPGPQLVEADPALEAAVDSTSAPLVVEDI